MKWTESYKYGDKAEQRFANILPNPIFATNDQNIFEHWDVANGDIKYDVKAMKKFRRSDPTPTDRIHYVELKNVNGKAGWLYGKADYIAFETRSYWVIVSRQRLQELIEYNSPMETSEAPQVYKLYTRSGRKDMITMIPTIDLIAIADRMIRKIVDHDAV
jgi:DNA-binding Lrp family transcriptional regulator